MKIGVIGLGLIGGSILKSLSEQGYDVAAVTRNKDTLNRAAKIANEVSSDISVLKDCDVIFVAVPMSKTLKILEDLEAVLPAEAIVADVCSLKEFVMQKKRPYHFIGTHPMAGTENSGYDSSFAELFEGAKWVLTPPFDMSPVIFAELEVLIEAMGAIPVYADAAEHDAAVAKISHMPMLLAQALFKSVKEDELALELAASGFRDMTRLAMSNVDMAEDMVNMNTKNILKALDDVNLSVQSLKTDYKNKIINIKEQRSKMYDENGKNIL